MPALLDPEHPFASARSVTIVKPSSLGDIVHALPCLDALHRAYPDLDLHWIVRSEWAPLLDGNGILKEVIPFPRDDLRGVLSLPRILAWGRSLRDRKRERPEVVLDLQGLMRSALISRARGGDLVAGLKEPREGGARAFYQVCLDSGEAPHAVDQYRTALGHLGVPLPTEIRFPMPEGSKPKPEGGLPDRFVLLHPFARGESKALAPDVLRALCESLAPLPVVLAGVSKPGTEGLPENVCDLVNRTSLPELIWLCRHAETVVSVDSGPGHIAAAVADRLLVLHTWSDPRKVGPYGDHPAWKAGEIASATNLDPEIAGGPGREIKVSDVPGIADWVRA